MVVRRHRDTGEAIWRVFANMSRDVLRNFTDIGPTHPVWSDRPYAVFLYDPPGVCSRVGYVNRTRSRSAFTHSTTTL
jgi:hypothetical protein